MRGIFLWRGFCYEGSIWGINMGDQYGGSIWGINMRDQNQ